MIGRAGGGFPECVDREGVLSIENQLFSQKTSAQIPLPNYLIARHCQNFEWPSETYRNRDLRLFHEGFLGLLAL
jgi:hypothetical protein